MGVHNSVKCHSNARLKITKIRNKFSLLLALRVGLPYHRLIGSSAHRLIGSSAHRLKLRLGVGGSAHRAPHLHNLTPELRPTIAHRFIGGPIAVFGLDRLTRSFPAVVTHDMAVSGAGSDVTLWHSAAITMDGAQAARPTANSGSLLAAAQTTPRANIKSRIYANPLTA